MKAVRLKEGQIVNPLFSAEARREAKANRQSYDVPEFLALPVGEIVDDPDCWLLCIDSNPAMAPEDDECAAKVLAVMSSPARKEFLTRIKRLSHPDVKKQLSKGEQEWIEAMVEVYETELAAL